jgi:hypothetical protein
LLRACISQWNLRPPKPGQLQELYFVRPTRLKHQSARLHHFTFSAVGIRRAVPGDRQQATRLTKVIEWPDCDHGSRQEADAGSLAARAELGQLLGSELCIYYSAWNFPYHPRRTCSICNSTASGLGFARWDERGRPHRSSSPRSSIASVVLPSTKANAAPEAVCSFSPQPENISPADCRPTTAAPSAQLSA